MSGFQGLMFGGQIDVTVTARLTWGETVSNLYHVDGQDTGSRSLEWVLRTGPKNGPKNGS